MLVCVLGENLQNFNIISNSSTSFESQHLSKWSLIWETVNCVGLTVYCCRRFPSNLANLSKMDVLIKDAYAKITASMKLLSSVLFYLYPLWNVI